MLGVEPNLRVIRDVNLFIDDPENKVPEIRERALRDPDAKKCLEKSFSDLTIVWVFESLGHDLRSQRVSPRRMEWSRISISASRRFIACLYGQEYSLLVDLHHLLDMAIKFCCDEEVLFSWAGEVGIHSTVLDYYKRYKQIIELDLDCKDRRKKELCSRRNLYRLLREGKEEKT